MGYADGKVIPRTKLAILGPRYNPATCKALRMGFQLRLRGGNRTHTSYSGRVEVRVGQHGSWGTVCDDYFDHQDAKVICKYLGFSRGKAMTEAYFGEGNGGIQMDDLRCEGWETTPFGCCYG